MVVISSTDYTYAVVWSAEDGEYVATVAEFPSLSWLARSAVSAKKGIVRLVDEVLEDMVANSEPIPSPKRPRKLQASRVRPRSRLLHAFGR